MLISHFSAAGVRPVRSYAEAADILSLAQGGIREDEHGVDAAEAERVGEDAARAVRAAASGDIIEVAAIVAILEVEGGRDPAALHGQTADGGLDGA